MTRPRSTLVAAMVIVAGALWACASGPKVPDWRINAVGHADRFAEAYLKGDERVAAREFALARSEVARTGRPELVARIELTRCAAQVAALVFGPCTGFAPLRADAGPAERAYADYLAGQPLAAAEVAQLPAVHQRAAAGAALPAADQPLARLIATGVLLQRGQATPAQVEAAVATASEQGWRRPLLAWLGVQARLADERGDAGGAARIRRRMDLVAPPKAQ